MAWATDLRVLEALNIGSQMNIRCIAIAVFHYLVESNLRSLFKSFLLPLA